MHNKKYLLPFLILFSFHISQVQAQPVITNVVYDVSDSALVVTGTGFEEAAGATNDVDVSLLTFTGEGGSTYTLTDSPDVERTSDTQFSVSLSVTDSDAIHLILNKNGVASTGGTAYNLAAADNYITNVVGSGSLTNAISVGNVLVPELSSATYDASSGTLLVTGLNFLVADGSNNDVDVSLLTFKGEGASTYTLTDSADVDVSKRTLFTVTLSSTDKAAVNLILNTNGTTATSGDAYNLGAAEDWAKGADATVNVLDNSSNAIVVSNVVLPIITSANYDAGSGTLLVSGSHFVSASGSSNDIDASLLTLTGEGGSTYTLTNTGDVDVGNPTTFTVVLSATDKAAVNLILNKAGTSSTVGTSYNLAAAEDWALGTLNNETIADTSGNGVTVSNVGTPTVVSATYDYIANQLTLTGTNFHSASGANNDVDVSAISITGDGSATHTLGSSSDVEIINGTTVTILLTGTDLIAIEALLNSNGSASANADIYNLAVADDWNPGTDPAVSSGDFTNVISVTNFTNPTIIRADYDATSGVLLVTGNNFVANAGASNDIDTSLLTILGANNDTYALTNSADVELTSDNAFSVTLSATDLIHINGILNKNGTDSGSAISYNLSVADNWMAGSPAANSIEDTVSNPVTVINTPTPTISSAIYDVDTGSLVVTGTHLAHLPGANNDIDVSLFTFNGDGGDTYRLTDSPDVDVSTTTSFSLTLSATDRTEVNKILNKNGTIAADAVAYNLAAAQGWEKAADVSITLTDLTGNSITVINVDTQTQEPDPPPPPLVVADSFVLLLEKQSVSIAFFGGKGPFTVISDTPSVASVVLNGTSVTITPGVEGSSSVFIEDSVGQIAIIKVVVQDGVFEPEPVPEKEMELIIGGGVTSDDGDTFSESGEVSVGDKIQIIATVVPYANHVGEGAGILVALIEAGNPDTIVLLKADGGFIEFNNRSLEFFTEIILAQYNEVDITRGESMTITADTVGSYAIYIAYQLFSNGVIYYAGDPIRIDVIE